MEVISNLMGFEVVCVDIDRSSPYAGNGDCRCIERIGYKVGDTTSHGSPEQIYEKIEERDRTFYVEYLGDQTDLIAEERGGTKYVRTEPNYTDDDNLLHQSSY
ncbi:DUF3892 domain-containing protein [Halorussus ruber]|uniref:DUF3892 domain-containing protein n=1 Tax=Halorussus ruber TaxID=1126238 RepID=UPI00109305ED